MAVVAERVVQAVDVNVRPWSCGVGPLTPGEAVELRRGGGIDQQLAGIDASIKGGAGVLRGLDTSVYSGERHAQGWVSAFAAKPDKQQVALLAELFKVLPTDEQRLVIGSLM